MKTEIYPDKLEWLAGRRGKITGTRAGDITPKRGGGRKIGFYELVAERLGVPDDGENPMERGARLEAEAVERFELETHTEVNKELVIWMRDDNESIAVSPDGIITEEEALECKCLSSARHLEAFITQKVPSEYEEQTLQYFVVNDKLQKLNVAFYDPRLSMFVPKGTAQAKLDFFVIQLKREDLEVQIKESLEVQKKVLAEVDEIVIELTF